TLGPKKEKEEKKGGGGRQSLFRDIILRPGQWGGGDGQGSSVASMVRQFEPAPGGGAGGYEGGGAGAGVSGGPGGDAGGAAESTSGGLRVGRSESLRADGGGGRRSPGSSSSSRSKSDIDREAAMEATARMGPPPTPTLRTPGDVTPPRTPRSWRSAARFDPGKRPGKRPAVPRDKTCGADRRGELGPPRAGSGGATAAPPDDAASLSSSQPSTSSSSTSSWSGGGPPPPPPPSFGDEVSLGPDEDLEVEAEAPHWQLLLKPEQLARLGKQEVKRQDVINELLHTERAHVRMLKVLKALFCDRLVHLGVAPEAEVRQIFPNLDVLLPLH
ncbi:unnamed protein product, partial [Lampetra fluviatilis]